MTGPGEMESRVGILEREVARLRELAAIAASDAAGARLLAVGADRDVADVRAEVRAHTRVLGALRETQLEQQQELQRHTRELQELRAAQIEQGQRMADGFATLNVGMTRLTTLLGRIAGPEQS